MDIASKASITQSSLNQHQEKLQQIYAGLEAIKGEHCGGNKRQATDHCNSKTATASQTSDVLDQLKTQYADSVTKLGSLVEAIKKGGGNIEQLQQDAASIAEKLGESVQNSLFRIDRKLSECSARKSDLSKQQGKFVDTLQENSKELAECAKQKSLLDKVLEQRKELARIMGENVDQIAQHPELLAAGVQNLV